MADNLSKMDRHKNMVSIKSKHTKPELLVRRFLFKKGFRYRLHATDLPGKPDLALKKYKTVINVYGCFWHHHKNCKKANYPKSNTEYWLPKIKKNMVRDKKNTILLKKNGWKEIIIWECELRDHRKLNKIINKLTSST